MTFGEKLKEMRKSEKMSQRQLAERIGITKSVISCYELGDKYPSCEVLVRIARLFHTSADYLLGIEREKMINVSGLTEEEIAAVTSIVNSLKNKNNK